VGDGDHDQGDEELQPVANVDQRGDERDVGEACSRSVPSSKATVALVEFLYELKAGPAGGRLWRPPSRRQTRHERHDEPTSLQ
jgi:hypothetical protein